MKKTRRLLLATAALSTAAAIEACSKEPLPGNPKGSHYDDAGPVALPANPKGSHYDQGLDSGTATPPPSATPERDAGPVLPPPANPKGSHYDSGLQKPKPPAK